jgi:rhamnosyltransferase
VDPDGTLNGMYGTHTQPTVAVLLSVYNGQEYLTAQLESLFAQSYPALHVFLRDDGSCDRSRELIAGVIGRRATLMRDDGGRLGPGGSFLRLLGAARADIYMFCDQDDVWLPNKVSNAVAALQAANIDAPVLYHTDLTVVDDRLRVVAPSFHAHEGIRFPMAHEMRRLAVQNCVVGCTTAFTDALVERSRLREGTPLGVAMHDWWLALLAACVGRIVYEPRAAILYRQHASNVSGTRKRSRWQQVRAQLSSDGVRRINAYRTKVAAQARSFLSFYGDDLPADASGDLDAVARLQDASHLSALWSCVRRGIWLQSPHMNAAIAYSSLVAPAFAVSDEQQGTDAVRVL